MNFYKESFNSIPITTKKTYKHSATVSSCNVRYKVPFLHLLYEEFREHDTAFFFLRLMVTLKFRLWGTPILSSKFDIHMSVHRNIITNYSQQSATFLKFIYFYRHSTCFRRFLRPSSGARNCTSSFRYWQPLLLLAASRTQKSSNISHVVRKCARNTWLTTVFWIRRYNNNNNVKTNVIPVIIGANGTISK
jgi:hypothetical protein